MYIFSILPAPTQRVFDRDDEERQIRSQMQVLLLQFFHSVENISDNINKNTSFNDLPVLSMNSRLVFTVLIDLTKSKSYVFIYCVNFKLVIDIKVSEP